MTTLTELKDQLTTIQAQIAAMDAKEKPWPQYGDVYWYVDGKGAISQAVWGDWATDNDRKSIGNIFRTKEEAEQHVIRLKAMTRLREMQNGFKPDWEDVCQAKFLFCVNEGKWHKDVRISLRIPGWVYYRTAEERDAAFVTLTDAEKEALLNWGV